MTQQYIVGELSILLARLQMVVADPDSACVVARLRSRVEQCPIVELGGLAWCALDLTDDLCRASLARGDAVGFDRQAAIGAELCEFAVCAHLLDEERGNERWPGV